MISKEKVSMLCSVMSNVLDVMSNIERILCIDEEDYLYELLFEVHGAQDYLYQIQHDLQMRYWNEFGHPYENTCIDSKNY